MVKRAAIACLAVGLSVAVVGAGFGAIPIMWQNAGSNLGVASKVNCSTNMSCSASGGVVTLTATSGGGGAPTTSQYWVGAADATLSAEKDLSALATGLVINTAGVPSAYGGASCTNQFPRSLSASGAPTCAGVALADFVANLGTTTTVLHGNAAGQPTYGSVVSGDISGPLTQAVGGTGAAALTCTNQFVTSNGTAYSCVTDTLASAQHANQGTTTTVLHGNAAGNPSFAGIGVNDFTANQGTTTTYLAGNAAGQPSWSAVALTSVTGAPTKTFVTADVNVTSATASLITGLTLTVAASTSYGFQCNIVETNTSTSAMRYAVSTPASPTTVAATVIHNTTALTTAVTEAITGAWATTCTNCTAAVTSSVSATTHNTILSGVVLNGANTGSIQIFAAASTAAQANVVKKGSWCEWWTP